MGRINGILFLLSMAISLALVPQKLQKYLNQKPSEEIISDVSQFKYDLPSNLSDEELHAMLEKGGSQVEYEVNPIVRKLLDKKGSGVKFENDGEKKEKKFTIEKLDKWIQVHYDQIKKNSIIVSVGWIVLGLIFTFTGVRVLARLVFSYGHFLGSSFLIVLSLFSSGVLLVSDFNLWIELPREIWIWLMVIVFVSAGVLRLQDMNYPIWNRTIKCLSISLGAYFMAFFGSRFI